MMLRRFKKENSWTKLIIILSLMFLVFSFGVIAQPNSEKPLATKTLAALIVELKDVVSKNAFNEKNAAMVAQRWDKRNDLAGKTKRQVIELLYDDVKSVIKNSGTRYEIYSIFSFYKQIPDNFATVQTQPKLSKPEAVKQLTNLTFSAHPFVGIEAEIAKLPGTKEIKAEEENAKKVRFEVFEDALKVNNKLTADQKSFVRANYDRLSKMADKIIDDTIKKNFPTEQWVMEGLDKSYSAKFTLNELNDLIHFFDSDNGAQVLKYIRQTNMEQIITGNGGKLDFTPADKAEHDKFVATTLGKKFMTAFITETNIYEQKKENSVRRNVPNADGFAILETPNLNKFFNQFVAENYKK